MVPSHTARELQQNYTKRSTICKRLLNLGKLLDVTGKAQRPIATRASSARVWVSTGTSPRPGTSNVTYKMAYIMQQLVSVLGHSYSKRKRKTYTDFHSYPGAENFTGPQPLLADESGVLVSRRQRGATVKPSARCSRTMVVADRLGLGRRVKVNAESRPLPSCPAKEYSEYRAQNSYMYPARKENDDNICDGDNTTHCIERRAGKGGLPFRVNGMDAKTRGERRGWTSGTEVTVVVLSRELADSRWSGRIWSAAATPRAAVALHVQWSPEEPLFSFLPLTSSTKRPN